MTISIFKCLFRKSILDIIFMKDKKCFAVQTVPTIPYFLAGLFFKAQHIYQMIFPSLTLGLLDTLECGLFPAWCSFCIVDQPCSFHYGHRQATPTLSYRDWLGAWIPKMVHTSLFLQSCWAVSLCSCMTWKPNSTSEC